MERSETGVVVVGGGSTGTGIVRDLAVRGVEATLVERGNLTHGTTGRMHGLLHSGGRYAVSDPASARACIAENRVLREIATHCVEPTGGLFVKRPEDPADYFAEKLRACRDCGIPAEELSGREAREIEPNLGGEIERAIRVPDAAIDPLRLCVANAADARERGCRIETHAEVTDVLVEDDAVVGVEVVHDSGPGPRKHGTPGETERIRAEEVVNATGAWADRLGAMAGVNVAVRPSKGAMTVLDCRPVDTVINRCRPRDAGDIVVPHGPAAILGTTDEAVDHPEDYPEEEWEVELLVAELAKLVPVIVEADTRGSYWGVRPLYDPSDADGADPGEATRSYSLLDHADRDGRPGLTTIVGGKLTTHREMAEAVVDHVCGRLGVGAPCRTDEVPLSGSEDADVLESYMDEFGLQSLVARWSA